MAQLASDVAEELLHLAWRSGQLPRLREPAGGESRDAVGLDDLADPRPHLRERRRNGQQERARSGDNHVVADGDTLALRERLRGSPCEDAWQVPAWERERAVVRARRDDDGVRPKRRGHPVCRVGGSREELQGGHCDTGS